MPPRTVMARFLLMPENRSALAACQDLLLSLTSGQADPTPNPLVLHGPPGSGKTHLVQTLAEELSGHGIDVCQRSANDFALPDDVGDAREAALTIIEDMQHLPTRAVPAVIALIDERLRHGGAMIFTALHGPANLKHRGTPLPARLTSRLAVGLVVGLEPMQKASRRRLLTAHAEQAELRVGAEILDWLAEHLTGGGRQLDGAIRQLKSLQGLQAKPLRLADIRAHFRTQIEATAPTVKGIAEHVSGYYQVAPRHLVSARRARAVLLPRQVSMYLARQLTTQSLVQIGKYFGGRDHKTVQHAVRKVEAAMKEDAALSGAVRQMHAELA
jgi:chromosomal replication initiator protein